MQEQNHEIFAILCNYNNTNFLLLFINFTDLHDILKVICSAF